MVFTLSTLKAKDNNHITERALILPLESYRNIKIIMHISNDLLWHICRVSIIQFTYSQQRSFMFEIRDALVTADD